MRNRSSGHSNPRPDPPRVGLRPAQTHRDSWRGGIVSINTQCPIQIVDHHVQVAVVVEVSQRHTVRDTHLAKPPCAATFLEGQIATIAKRQFGFGQRREHEQFLANLLRPVGSARPDTVLRIHILRVEHVASGSQDILESIKVHVQENDRPVPLGVFEPRVMRDFRVGAVPSVPL